MLSQGSSAQSGERIAIKAAYVKKHGLTFETWGNTVSVMAIKATGVIAENMGDGRRLRVHWQRASPARKGPHKHRVTYCHRRTANILGGE